MALDATVSSAAASAPSVNCRKMTELEDVMGSYRLRVKQQLHPTYKILLARIGGGFPQLSQRAQSVLIWAVQCSCPPSKGRRGKGGGMVSGSVAAAAG